MTRKRIKALDKAVAKRAASLTSTYTHPWELLAGARALLTGLKSPRVVRALELLNEYTERTQ